MDNYTVAVANLQPAGKSHKHIAVLHAKAVDAALAYAVDGMQVRVLGEGFTPEDEEDSALAEVSKVWAYQARYRVPLTKATAGKAANLHLPFVHHMYLPLSLTASQELPLHGNL